MINLVGGISQCCRTEFTTELNSRLWCENNIWILQVYQNKHDMFATNGRHAAYKGKGMECHSEAQLGVALVIHRLNKLHQDKQPTADFQTVLSAADE